MLRNREIRYLIAPYLIIGVVATGICSLIESNSGFICGAAFICAGAVVFVFTRNRYKKIAELSDYIRKLSEGKLVSDIRDNTEGELSILRDDIYKLALGLSEQANALRRDKAKLKDTLFDISHQLKTTLTSLTIMAELLEREGLPEEKRREFLNNLQAGLFRMEWLVTALLKMARLDAGTEPLKAEKVNVNELIKLAGRQVMTMLDLKEQKLEMEIDGGLQTICDINWTVEALVNILKNASEHTPENGVIAVSADENPVCVWITVTDSGEGIDSGDIPYLFKRFYKGKHSSKDSVGIGLAMSMSIMQNQNGDIEVKTEKGRGSSFTLKFYKSAI